MRRKTFIMPGQVAVAACMLLMVSALTTSCKDEVLTGQPEWLGNSIYERLQEDGHYTVVQRLIEDLGQREVLAHTGSKTLFVADDAAYAEWFKQNRWGVGKYEDLTDAQKKLLLNNSMIDNAYLVELMSNSKAKAENGTPIEGTAMRRATSVSIYDSVYIMQPTEFPPVKAWDELRAAGKAVPILRDMTTPPMIHFLPAFMQYHKITDEDLSVLTNGQAQSIAEAWVNGKRISERDITCKNGYIQKVDGVVEASPNMAEIIHQHDNISQWASLLDRFSFPVRDDDGMDDFGPYSTEYNRLYNRKEFVYTLGYYSDRYANDRRLKVMQDKNEAGGKLLFDPGWNQYISARLDIDMHNDAGVMIAPTNDALDEFFNGEGKALKEEFGSWDNVNIKVLTSLLRNHQLSSFTEAVPSKFGKLLNDAFEPLGITKNDVVSSYMACNGVVYVTNKVFMPVEFQSVLAPALLHTNTMNIIYWALTGAELFLKETKDGQGHLLNTETYPFNFKPFLLSMNSRYGLLLPTNEALQTYIDPYSYGNGGEVTEVGEDGESTSRMKVSAVQWEYDKSKNQDEYVQAKSVDATVNSDGTLTPISSTNPTELEKGKIQNLLQNLINQLVIVIPDSTGKKTLEDYVNEGYSLFLTNGGSIVRAKHGPNGQLCFEGGWQMEGYGDPVEVSDTYNERNGTSFTLSKNLPLQSTKSFLMVLNEHEEYSGFLQLAKNDLASQFKSLDDDKNVCGSRRLGNENFKLFDSYNYTVYIPSNSAIEQLQKDGLLPSYDILHINFSKANGEADSLITTDALVDVDVWRSLGVTDKSAYRKKTKEILSELVGNFIRYHVQDHSVAIGLASERQGGTYESMMRNPVNKRFYPINVYFDNQQLSVTDATGKTYDAITTPGLYNNVIREYWFNPKTTEQVMASDAVVHLINGALMYEEMKPWRQVVREKLIEAFPPKQ